MNTEIGEVLATLSADATSLGKLTFTAVTGLVVGAICQLSDNTGLSVTVQITSIPDTTHVFARLAAQPDNGPAVGQPIANGSPYAGSTLTQNLKPNYGNSDLSAFKLANSATLYQNKQIVRVEPSNVALPSA